MIARPHRWEPRGIVATAVVLAALVVTGCMSSGDVIAGRPWRLASIAGRAPAAEAGVTFGTEGLMTVSTGCNSGGGTYRLDGNRLYADGVALTAVGCTGAIGEQDVTFTHVLQSTPTFAVDTGSGQLRLTGPDGVVLLFDAP